MGGQVGKLRSFKTVLRFSSWTFSGCRRGRDPLMNKPPRKSREGVGTFAQKNSLEKHDYFWGGQNRIQSYKHELLGSENYDHPARRPGFPTLADWDSYRPPTARRPGFLWIPTAHRLGFLPPADRPSGMSRQSCFQGSGTLRQLFLPFF